MARGLSVCLSGLTCVCPVSLGDFPFWLSVSLRTCESHLFQLASPALAPCPSWSLSTRISVGVCLGFSSCFVPSLWVSPFSLPMSFDLFLCFSPCPWVCPTSLTVCCYACLSFFLYISFSVCLALLICLTRSLCLSVSLFCFVSISLSLFISPSLSR